MQSAEDPSRLRLQTAMWKEYAVIARPVRGLESEASEDYWDCLIAECLRLMADHPEAGREWITQEMVERAASIRGPKVMELLFARSHTVPNSALHVSKAIVVAAAVNTVYDHEILPFLENKCGGIGLDELEAAAANSDVALECLLNRDPRPPMAAPPLDSHQERQLPEGKQTIGQIIAKNCRRRKNLQEVLDRQLTPEPKSPGDVEKLVKAAVQNRHGLEMAGYLPERYQMTDHRIRISPALLEAAAANPFVAPEMLRLLLNTCEDGMVESVITLDVLLQAAKNCREAPEALRMLLMEHRGPGNRLTLLERRVLIHAAENNPHKPLQIAIREFESILTDEQRRQLHATRAVPEADSILRFTAELDSRDKNRRGPSIASRLYLCQAIDAGHNHIIRAVWKSSEQEFKSDMDTIQGYSDDVKDAIALAKAQADAQDQQLQAQERKEASASRRNLSTFFSRHDSQVDQIRKWQIEKDERQIYEVVKLLQGITPVRKPSYIIIDGLDECDKPERNKLMKALSTLAFPALDTKLFLSSRSSLSEEIQNTFPSFEHLTMTESSVHDDIKTYVNGVIEEKLESKDLRVGDASLIEDIKQALIQGADGMSTKSAHSIATRISAKLSKIFRRT
ncbi:hypothetical protein DL767_000703 [Monosporascus sp. MG133]|nr:hypothetical protein DL767_000703 [Monosporascus sp. MG133]